MPSSTGAPIPPPELRAQVAGIDDKEWFTESGKRSVADLRRALAAGGRGLDTFGHVLDFGCGCGRMARWLLDEPGLQYTGIDIDQALIDWCKNNLSGAYVLGPGLPPTPLGDKTFDLIVSHSVFSHLDEEYQDRWLSELHRLIQPGGMLVISFHGPTAFSVARQQLDVETRATWRAELETKGLLFVRDSAWPQFPDFYQSTYHAPWYVEQHWQRWFDLLAYIPHLDLDYQDVVVLRRRTEDEVALPIVAHRTSARQAVVLATQSIKGRSRALSRRWRTTPS